MHKHWENFNIGEAKAKVASKSKGENTGLYGVTLNSGVIISEQFRCPQDHVKEPNRFSSYHSVRYMA